MNSVRYLSDALGLEESELADLIYTKWQAIVDRIWEEYKQTEEYAARQENCRINLHFPACVLVRVTVRVKCL